MMPSNTLPDHHVLFDLIQARLALTLDDQRRADVVRIVDEQAASGDINGLQGLMLSLSEAPITHPHWQKLIKIATIGETYFFRDQSQLNALRLSVLPGLIDERRREGKRSLRIWSAGCSTGEEPYTLAMLLRELIPDFNAWDISILATDLNLGNIERARRGVYRPWSFRSETPDDVRQRWFAEEEGGYRIDPAIRDMVTFASLNLASNDYPCYDNHTMDMDVILCRNVLIYFDIPSAQAVVARFGKALRQNGWLVLGHAESACKIASRDLQPCNFDHAVLYQKCVQPEQDYPSTPRAPEKLPISISTPIPCGAMAQIPLMAHSGETKAKPVAISLTPLDPLEHAWQAANREEWNEASHWVAEALKKHKMRPEVHYLRGVIELQQGEIEKGLTSLRQAVYCDANFVMAHFTLGEVYEQRGHYRKAANQWNQVRSLLEGLAPEEQILFSNDLTAEMLSGFLQYRLDKLPLKGEG